MFVGDAFINTKRSIRQLILTSTAHIMRIHLVLKKSSCRIRLVTHYISVDIDPIKTLYVDSSLVVKIESECSNSMKNIGYNSLCLIRLATLRGYLSTTMNLNYYGQSAPRCHSFAVSVFDQAKTLKFFDYPKANGADFLRKRPIVKFEEGQEIPLTVHANPLFLREEVCQTREVRYVSTTNSVILIVYINHLHINSTNFNITVTTRQTDCQAFTQFPLEFGFVKRLIENDTYSVEPTLQLANFDHSFIHYVVLALGNYHHIFGVGVYLRNAQVTYYKEYNDLDIFVVVVRKVRDRCFVYQYIHDIYYNTWRNKPKYYISLTITSGVRYPSEIRSINALPIYVHVTDKWLDNKTDDFNNSNTGIRSNIFLHLQNRVTHTRLWSSIVIKKHQCMVELTYSSLSDDRCSNISNWYTDLNKNKLWHHLPAKTIEFMYSCYRFGTSLINCVDPSIATYVDSMREHTLNCMNFLITPVSFLHYWLIVPYNNRALLMSYTKGCSLVDVSDMVTVSREIPSILALQWGKLPNIEIGYFGNPMYQTALILQIQRTLVSVKYSYLCSIIVNVSTTVSKTIKTYDEELNDKYVLMPSNVPLSWTEAEKICHGKEFAMFEPNNIHEEKYVLASVLKKVPSNIPIPIFCCRHIKGVGTINNLFLE